MTDEYTRRRPRKRPAKKKAYGLCARACRDILTPQTVRRLIDLPEPEARMVDLCLEEIVEMLERKQGREWLPWSTGEPDRTLSLAGQVPF